MDSDKDKDKGKVRNEGKDRAGTAGTRPAGGVARGKRKRLVAPGDLDRVPGGFQDPTMDGDPASSVI